MLADPSLRLPSTSERWAGAQFRAELADWVAGPLGPGVSLEPLRQRPWSTVWRARSAAGVHFAKQNTPLQSFEARLVQELARLTPAAVVPVTAADAERGLLLTPDQGEVLGDVPADDAAALALVSRVVGAAAQLQRALVPHVEALTAAGLTPLAPADAPDYVRRRLDELGSLPVGDPRGLEDGAVEALEGALPAIAADAERLAGLGLPLTLNHNDLHTHNVFEVDGALRFFDFGDALLAEPLTALRVPVAVLAHHLGCEPDDPRVLVVAEPALEVWSDLVPLPDLRRALPAALRLGALARCESWLRCLAGMTDDELAEWGSAPAYWLVRVAET